MRSVLDTYLGWESPRHVVGCERPEWDVSIRTDNTGSRYDRVPRYGEDAVRHQCVAGEERCAHGGSFEQVTVRIVCRSCGTARVVTGEKTPDTGEAPTSTRRLGYGVAPRQAAGLLLWPASPWLPFGRDEDAEPYDFVVTRIEATEVTEDTVVGQISQSRGRRRGLVWTALAVPSAAGQYGASRHLQFVHANDGLGRGGAPLRTVKAAARWIGARLAESPVDVSAGEETRTATTGSGKSTHGDQPVGDATRTLTPPHLPDADADAAHEERGEYR